MACASPNGAAQGDMAAPSAATNASPRQAIIPKKVTFELLFTESQARGRLPMRVHIYPHDTTDSIVTTVKNFYGLYPGANGGLGVSFEDQDGTTLIARYENFRHDMTVYVRVTEEPPATVTPFIAPPYKSSVSGAPYNESDSTFPRQPTTTHLGRDLSRSPRRRSPSPNGTRGRRSASANTNPNASKKSRSRSVKESAADIYSETMNGYSSGDGAPSSSSGRAKEHIGNTDISVENIVEGGRRKRAKFESSELPLFAPPQMPAATSNPSISPARRVEHNRPSLPFVQPRHNTFAHVPPLHSPQQQGTVAGHTAQFATPAPDTRRARGSIGYPEHNNGILPTPDPTVGSCMSEEDKDVAIQLMRLGEMSNISHGRTSASTLDDTFSGHADIASSTGATSDGESDSEEEPLPESRRQKLDAAGAMRKIYQTTDSHFQPAANGGHAHGDVVADFEDGMDVSTTEDAKARAPKTKTPLPDGPRHRASSTGTKTSSKSNKGPKAPRAGPNGKMKKAASIPAMSNGPMSPTSLPPSRKPSNASAVALPPGIGEEDQVDLSAKPRCQRCRKSKKGCDRQRPCGRCRDAGLSADQCISEDEGNGRKGRYGRHMGVPIKKEEILKDHHPSLLPAAPISTAPTTAADKNKKRKR
ncbi:hypothetical protein SODALDRAFT_106161 [Sodiomyces alkalinus F11]|uniref:Zn(2)-C6 fungal-type domain-containing protein n=1 Tax=Sodiomyces alkalinus (strain CBS 110278 / VKM F-3762 / F11) TaxID=1314773 RepID=A0A3N2Q2B0_SODAK|nr:hypothetical protein SODALDRAFT_106161 [Sodiomyces alkalinus F11]ROT40856.1 hypothetical protein SODALDRAFT_106161 [Sodiomyces alkalinus F11]